MKFDFNSIIESASRFAHMSVFKAKQHSPEILIVVGTVSIIAGTVHACKATLKAQDVIEDTSKKLDTVHGLVDGSIKKKDDAEYTSEDAGRDTLNIYVKTGISFAKLYAPSIILIGGGIGCMFGSHYIMRKRNAAAIAAYTAISNSFAEYRKRVAESIGEEAEKQIRSGLKATEIETGEFNEDGTPKKETVYEKEYSSCDPYAVLFDESNSNWEKDNDYNRMFLIGVKNEADYKLRTRGYLFLNEVYRMLGFPGTQVGQFAGWIYDPTNPNIDSKVDFGMYADDPEKQLFLEGYERSIWLTFNVDGNILDKFEKFDKKNK